MEFYTGHKPPAFTDTASGRYAGSLFTAASKSKALQSVLDDLTHLREVLRASPEFREVLKNSSVRRSKQREIFATFAPQNYSEITQRFIDTVIEAGRYPTHHAASPILKKPSIPTSNTAKFSTRRRTSASSRPSTLPRTKGQRWWPPSSRTSRECASK